MKTPSMAKRIESLERRVMELELTPRLEKHDHFHFSEPQDTKTVPQQPPQVVAAVPNTYGAADHYFGVLECQHNPAHEKR